MRGYWIHHDKQIGTAQYGRRMTTNEYKLGCGHYNPYIGYSDSVKVIDTRCRKCGKRVQFNNPILKPRLCKYGYYDGRGSVRQVQYHHRPNWSRAKIAKFCMMQNLKNRIEDDQGFVTALELSKRKSSRPGGGK